VLLTALIGIGGIGVVAASVVIEAIGNPWRSRRPCFAVLFAVAGIQLVAGPVTLGWHGYRYGYGGTRASGASVASPEAEKFAALPRGAPNMVKIGDPRAGTNRAHRGLHGSRPGHDTEEAGFHLAHPGALCPMRQASGYAEVFPR
jgi:hypothetical protein